MTKVSFPKVPTDELETSTPEGELAPGTLIDDKYRIVRKLGSGTVGHVYEAQQTLVGHGVALKVLSHEMAVRRDALMLLLHEARVANQIRHPNIVQMTDLAQTRDGLLYLVMELLEGEDLEQYVWRRDVMTRLESLDIVLQLCAGLSAAHARGVYHRDLKPQNIFLVRPEDPVPHVKILDFGLSRVRGPATRSLWYQSSDRPVGTPLYCAPEHIHEAGKADHRGDIYSLGVILYRMWTGRLPFDSPSVREVLRMHEEEPPPVPRSVRPTVTEHSEHILMRALAKDPNDRYQTVDELAADIKKPSAPARETSLDT